MFLHKGKACLLKMNYWWAPSARTREQLFPHTQTSSPQTLNIQVLCVFIGAARRKPCLQCLLKLPVLLAALLSQCSFQGAAGALWGCLGGQCNLARRGRCVQRDGEVLTVSRPAPAGQVGFAQLCAPGMAAWGGFSTAGPAAVVKPALFWWRHSDVCIDWCS